MKHLSIFLVALAAVSAQAAELQQTALPKDVAKFLEKENNCFIIEEQQSDAGAERCDWKRLGEEREVLLMHYQDASSLRETILTYNSKLWKYNIGGFYEEAQD